MRNIPIVSMCALLCLGCTTPQYTLVPAGTAHVGASRLLVTPGIPWNRVPPLGDQRRWETVWTQNGPLLDRVSLVGGLPDGQVIIESYEDDPAPVPDFHAGMSGDELVAMTRAMYQARGVSALETAPATSVRFLGGDGVRFGFRYSPEHGPSHAGVCVMRVVDGKLYALLFDAEASHYFGVVLPRFEELVTSARLR